MCAPKGGVYEHAQCVLTVRHECFPLALEQFRLLVPICSVCVCVYVCERESESKRRAAAHRIDLRFLGLLALPGTMLCEGECVRTCGVVGEGGGEVLEWRERGQVIRVC